MSTPTNAHNTEFFYVKTFKIAPTCFDPKIIFREDEGTWDDRVRDGGTKFILGIKEQETRLTLQEHDDDDEGIQPMVEIGCIDKSGFIYIFSRCTVNFVESIN
jgi:hypothetical protein